MAVKYIDSGNDDGESFGQSAASLISLYGVTPAAQRSGAVQATSLLSTASSTAIDTATKAFLIEVGNTLTQLGAWKGSA
jgi:hypothetical protein